MHAPWEYALLWVAIGASSVTLAVALWRWVRRLFLPTLLDVARGCQPPHVQAVADHLMQRNTILDDLPWKDEKPDPSTFRAEAIAVDPTDEVALEKFLERWRGKVPKKPTKDYAWLREPNTITYRYDTPKDNLTPDGFYERVGGFHVPEDVWSRPDLSIYKVRPTHCRWENNVDIFDLDWVMKGKGFWTCMDGGQWVVLLRRVTG